MLEDNTGQCKKIISAKVVAKDRNRLTLVIETGCDSCKSSCLMSSAAKKIIIKTDKSCNVGDSVSLVIDERHMLILAVLLYGIPLVIMFLTVFVLDMTFHNDSITAGSAFLSLIISWVILKYISKKLTYRPVKIRD